MQDFLIKLNKVVDEFVQDINDTVIALKISLGHKNRKPNVYATQFMGDKFSLKKLAFNEQNLYFDVNQFDTIDTDNFLTHTKRIMYQTAKFYLPYAQELADLHKQEYSMYVWLPVNFTIQNQTNKYMHQLNQTQQLSTATIDSKSRVLVDGMYLAEKGIHTITLNDGEAVLDMFNNCLINSSFYNLYVNSTGSQTNITVYTFQNTVLYFYKAQNTDLTLVLDDEYYILNYHYKFTAANETTIYAKNFTYPIVAMKLGG